MKFSYYVLILFVLMIGISFVDGHPTNSNSPYDDWRMFGRDTGFTRFTTSNAPANISNTTVITKTFTGDVDTVPAVVWDSVYLFPFSGDYSANYAYKLNASNISQVLANSTNQYAIRSAPTYYKNYLYLQQDTYLYQINASNLSQIIDYEYIADSTGWSQIPVIFNNSVWTGAGNYNPYVRQFNASNISQAIFSYYVYARPYDYIPVVGNYAYFYFSGTIYQASSSNISQVYRTVSCGDTNSGEAPAVGYGYYYRVCETGNQDTFVQLNASNISQQIANISINATTMALGNGYVYVRSGVMLHQLNASNISQQIAIYNLTNWGSYTSPAVTPDYVFASGGSVMYQLNASNISQKIGSYTAGSTIGSSPVVSKGFLYFGSIDDKLYQLGLYSPLPAIKVDYPLDEQVYANVTQLNYSLMQNSTHLWDKCWYSNDSGTTNYSVQNAGTNFGINPINGWNTYNIYCNDSNSNLYNDYTMFYIDTDTPIFTNAANKSINQTTLLSHLITATDIGGVNCFSVNDTTNFGISCSGLLTNNTFLAVGNYSLNITVYDYANHYNSTILTVNILDSVAPLLSIVSPANNTNTTNTGLNINYSVFDVGTAVNSCWYSNDSFSTNYTLAGCANITSVIWSEGVHNLRLWANDSSGNRNISTLRFTIDTTAPVFNNVSNQTLIRGNSFSYQLNATDSTLSVSCFSVNNTNFTVSCSGLLQNSITLLEGVYPLNITVNDSVNNINSVLLIVNVTTRPIIGLQLVSPIGNINATQNRTFDVSVNVSCFATDCGAINVSLDPIFGNGLNYSMYNSSELGADSYSWEELISTGIGTAIWNNTNLDEGSSTLNLPFNFTFYGANYSRIYVVPNGRVDFTSDYTGSYSIALPHPSLKSVAAANQDLMLYSSSGAKVFYANRTNPNRVVVQYYNVSTYGASSTRYTFEIILYHDGKVKIQYNNSSTSYSQDDNNGLNFNSSNYLLIGADSPDQYSGKAVTFYPPGYALSSTKGGLITTTVGATPFYTTTQNPYNLNLTNGQSQIITWTVNATGSINNTYEFFVYANKTSDLGVGNITSSWNVTITGESGALPSINILYPIQSMNYSTNISILNYSVTGNNLSRCWYSTNSGTTNSSDVQNGTNFTSVASVEGSNTWYVYCNNTEGNVSGSSVSFNKDTTYPTWIANKTNLTSLTLNGASVYFNVTFSDLNPGRYIFSWFNGTVWINNSAVSYSNMQDVSVVKTLGIDTGVINWTWYFNDSVGNVNRTDIWGVSLVQDNIAGLTISCEAGGPYQQGAMVLVQGNITNSTSVISNNSVILNITNSSGPSITSNVTSSSLGTFQSIFSGLSVGAYNLNASTTHQGFTQSCVDSFSVGGSANLILDKVVSLISLTNESASYNISLNVINLGLSDALGVALIDSDSNESPYNLGDISANSSIRRSFIKSFERNSSTYEINMSMASVNATDSYSSDTITANSSQIILGIPSYEDQDLILIKNVYYNSENSTYVNYTLSLQIINSGGVDLDSIVLIDSDLGLSESISLLVGEDYNLSSSILVEKAASNTNKLFVRASAVINNITYRSNQIQVRIPGYGGPADAIVNAPASVIALTSFDSQIEVRNMNEYIGQDFVIDYWITNEAETVNYSSGQQTIYVPASGSSELSATLTSPSSAGNYRLRAIVSWAGGTAISYDSFIVSIVGEEGVQDEDIGGSGGLITGNVINDNIVCDSPYIRHGVDCCLDRNNNSICDIDESDQVSNLADLSVNRPSSEESESNQSQRDILGIIVNKVVRSSSYISQIIKSTPYNNVLLSILIMVAIIFIVTRIGVISSIKNSFNFILSFLFTFWRKRDLHLLTNVKGMKVYSSSGNYIGIVVDAYIEKGMSKLYGWMIDVSGEMSKMFGSRHILVRQNMVLSIGEVMILKDFSDSDNLGDAEKLIEEQ